MIQISNETSCPACNSDRLVHRFMVDGHPLLRCPVCTLEMLHPQPGDEELAAIYNEQYQLAADSREENAALDEMKMMTARLYLETISNAVLPTSPKLLEIGCGWGHFLLEAQRAGFDTCGVELSPHSAKEAAKKVGTERIINSTIEKSELTPDSFDICVMIDVIEHVRDPQALLDSVRKLLRPGGYLFLVTPSTDSLSAKLMRRHWMEYKAEHIYSFSRKSLKTLLERNNYTDISFHAARKALNINFISAYFQRFKVPVLAPAIRMLASALCDDLLYKQLVLPAGGIITMARKS